MYFVPIVVSLKGEISICSEVLLSVIVTRLNHGDLLSGAPREGP